MVQDVQMTTCGLFSLVGVDKVTLVGDIKDALRSEHTKYNLDTVPDRYDHHVFFQNFLKSVRIYFFKISQGGSKKFKNVLRSRETCLC